jgi:hypothetical protein
LSGKLDSFFLDAGELVNDEEKEKTSQEKVSN